MKLEIIYKRSGNGCPTIYLAEDGDFVVQGDELDAATQGELQTVLPGETAVKISAELLLGAMLRYTNPGPAAPGR